MNVWAIADLHLSFGVEGKSMEVFGERWHNHEAKVKDNWERCVSQEDLVLIPGDISWAIKFDEALVDLMWIHELPGTKVMIRGNHDYWWGSLSKMRAILPPSIHVIQNDAFSWEGLGIAGSRLWDSQEYHFDVCVEYAENPVSPGPPKEPTEEDLYKQEKIFVRELSRLEASLKALDPNAKRRIVMTHYPPISHILDDSRASRLLEKYEVEVCVFGHVHSVRRDMELFGTKNGVAYRLCACDYVDCCPIPV